MLTNTNINTNIRWKATTTMMNLKSDKNEVNNNQPVKAGTHTYASWKSNDQERNNVNNNNNNNNEEIGTEGDEEYIEFDDDDDDENEDKSLANHDIDPPSPLLIWLRKVYEAVFFYGLDPAPAKQKSNKRKIMREAERSNNNKNDSPFFTDSEQRVQRYLSTKRNENERNFKRDEGSSRIKSQKGDQSSPMRSKNTATNRPFTSTDFEDNNKVQDQGDRQLEFQQREREKIKKEMENELKNDRTFDKKNDRINDEIDHLRPLPLATIIEDLDERLIDLTQELEYIDAELITSSPSSTEKGSKIDQNYPKLLLKKTYLEDLIENLEVELVTTKSKLKK